MGRLRHPGMKNENPPLWMTLSEACAHLGVKERALRSAVQRGEVERRKVGRESRYHLRTAALINLPEASINLPAAPIAIVPPLPQASPDDLDRLLTLTQERAEAIAIGMMLAEERDRLRAEVARLREGLLDLAFSHRALFLRRHIRSLLAASNIRT